MATTAMADPIIEAMSRARAAKISRSRVHRLLKLDR